MKVRMQEAKRVDPRLPAVGESWKIKGGRSTYYRVADIARLIFPSACEDAFFSIELGTGQFVWEHLGSVDNIIILRPVGGELVLEEAGDEGR